jgi:hypothetical protein
MDFFTELNEYVPEDQQLEAIDAATVADNPAALEAFDSIIVVNHMGERSYLTDPAKIGLTTDQTDRYFENLKLFARDGGNLVLTDAALRALIDLGLVSNVGTGRSLAPFFNFQLQAPTDVPIGTAQTQGQNPHGLTSYQNPKRWPLAAGLDLPGAAEQIQGRRQAVEPAPLGYAPDLNRGDSNPTVPHFWVTKAEWEPGCGKATPLDCTTAARTQNGPDVNLGERHIGHGVIRIAGIMLPDPVFAPDRWNDHRFGLASYALTYTGYQVFENLVNYRRPVGTGASAPWTI